MPNARNSSKRMIKEDVDIDAFPGSKEQFDKFLEPQIDLVSIRCLKPMIVNVIGEVTGNKYVFNGAGSVVGVNAEDVESIMKRNKRIQSCCGSYSSPYFEIL